MQITDDCHAVSKLSFTNTLMRNDSAFLEFTSILPPHPYEKSLSSNLSTQLCLFWDANFTPKIHPRYVPSYEFYPFGRVDNLDVISEIRINKGLQLCNQYYTLHMHRLREHVHHTYLLHLIPLLLKYLQIPYQGCWLT